MSRQPTFGTDAIDKEGKMGKVTAEEMQELMYGNSNNTARSGGSSPEKVSASEMENLMAPYRSHEIKHTVLSPQHAAYPGCACWGFFA